MGPLADQRVCLDTTFLVDLLRNVPEATEKAERLTREGWTFDTTSVNAFELFMGAFLATSPRRLTAAEGLLGEVNLLNLGMRESREAGRLLAGLQRRGETVEIRDVLIAGIAMSNDCHNVLTRNVTHFKRFGELKIMPY